MLSSIIRIVREAATLMATDSFDITQKEGYANIVTSSDLAVQQFLCLHLSTLLPGSGFLCEEEDMQDTAHEYTWVIDPIDGTANYSRGIRECAISVALCRYGEVIAAVVYLPRADELFSAERGKGAFLNGQPISVSKRPFADAVMCTALAVYHKEQAQLCADIIVETFRRCNDIRRFGAAAPELCFLAMGRCELYFEYLLSPWDFAAASLVLTEAGGVLCDLHGKPLSPLKPSGVLAANNSKNLSVLAEIAESKMSICP